MFNDIQLQLMKSDNYSRPIFISRGEYIYICMYVYKKKKEGRKCLLTTHSTHFIYGYMASVIW